jgi:hypothetical protein
MVIEVNVGNEALKLKFFNVGLSSPVLFCLSSMNFTDFTHSEPAK